MRSYSDDTLSYMFMMLIQQDQNRARLYVGHNCVFQKVLYKSQPCFEELEKSEEHFSVALCVLLGPLPDADLQ